MAKLTSRGLASGATLDDLIHIVITGDTTQDPSGSSFKATLGQLVPLFGGNSNVEITGGTASNTTGILTLNDSTGGTVTITGFTTTFTGGSGNCITDFYVTNVYGCSPITIHSEVQTSGATANGYLSYSFGDHTVTNGDFSIASGFLSETGSQNGYLATGCTAGVVTLDSSYGDVTGVFIPIPTTALFLDDTMYLGNIGSKTSTVSATTFNGSSTIVYLNDVSIDTLGGFLVISSTFVSPSVWSGDQIFGGLHSMSSNVSSYSLGEGSAAFNTSYSYGNLSFSEGTDTATYGLGSHAEGKSSVAIGNFSHAQNQNNYAIGINTHAGGNSSQAFGLNSFIHSLNSFVIGDNSVLLGGNGLTGYSDNTVYVPNMVVKTTYTPSGTTDTGGETGSITWDDNYLYYRDNNGWKRISGTTW